MKMFIPYFTIIAIAVIAVSTPAFMLGKSGAYERGYIDGSNMYAKLCIMEKDDYVQSKVKNVL